MVLTKRAVELSRFPRLDYGRFPGLTIDSFPLSYLPLQGTELDVEESAWETVLEIAEQGLGDKPGTLFQQVAKLGPNVMERILPGAPCLGVTDLLGWRSACRYFRADLASIPAFNAAREIEFPSPSNWRSLRTWASVIMAGPSCVEVVPDAASPRLGSGSASREYARNSSPD